MTNAATFSVGESVTGVRRTAESKEALAELKLAVAADPADSEALYFLGGILVQNGDFEAAVAPLEKARTLKPDDASTLLVLGDTYVSQGELEKALAAFDGYVKAGGSNGDIPALIEQLRAQIAAKKK